MKGQKDIRILAPMIGTRKKKHTEANKDVTKQNPARTGRISRRLRFRQIIS